MSKIKEILFKKKKIILYSSLSVASVIAITIQVIYLALKSEDSSKNKKITNNNESFFLTENDIFPEVDAREYYDYIEIENGEPVINDKMISFFITDIIKRLGVSYGDIKFNYKYENKKSVLVEFIWINEDLKVYKNYHLNIENNDI
ncbi:MHO_1590 family protein [Mycoplasma sp. CB776]